MSFDKKAFKEVQSKGHTKQAIWFLNGFWEAGMSEEAETVWDLTHRMIEIQMGRPKFYGAISKNVGADETPEGFHLDQFQAHRFLEQSGETKTAKELRTDLKTIDVDKDNNMSMTEYLMFKYGKSATEVINAPQGDGKKLREAEAKMNETRELLNELQTAAKAAERAANQAGIRATAAKALLNASNEAAATAKAALDDQHAAEAKVRVAEAVVKAAMDALLAEQKAFDDKLAKLQSIADDQSVGVVKRNRAKNEVEQLKSEDPLPLSRAKITQASALKKAAKESKKAARATSKAQKLADEAAAAAQAAAQAAQEAEAAAAEAALKKAEADRAAAAVEAKMQEIVADFERLKAAGDVAHGQIFWMEREMKEIRKYMR